MRLLGGKLLLKLAADEIAELEATPQLGLGAESSALEAAVFTAQSWASQLEGKVMVKLDVRNAFNVVNRTACCNAAGERVPSMGSYVRWCLGSSTSLWHRGQRLSAHLRCSAR